MKKMGNDSHCLFAACNGRYTIYDQFFAEEDVNPEEHGGDYTE